MATTVYATDEYINDAIHKFNKVLVPLNYFSYQAWTQPIPLQRATVNIGLVQNAQTASAFTGTYGLNTFDSITQVPVNLTHYIKTFAWPQTLADVNPLDVLTALSDTNLHALANQIFTTAVSPLVSGSLVSGSFTSANGYSTSVSGSSNANFSLTSVQTVAKTLASQSAVVSDCALLAPADFYINVIPTTNAIGTFVGNAFEQGWLSGYMGMKYAPYTAPFDPAGIVKGAGIAKNGVVVATGLPAASQGVKDFLVRYEVLDVEVLGCQVAYREWIDPQTHTQLGAFEIMAGAAAGNTDGATLIY